MAIHRLAVISLLSGSFWLASSLAQGTNAAAGVGFTFPCSGAPAALASGSWNCPTVNTTDETGSQGGKGSVSISANGSSSGGSVNFNVVHSLAASGTLKAINGHEYVTVSFYGSSPETPYSINIRYTVHTGVTQVAKTPVESGTLRAEGQLRGTLMNSVIKLSTDWDSTTNKGGSDDKDLSATVAQVSSKFSTPVNGFDYYLIGTLQLSTQVASNISTANLSTTAEVRSTLSANAVQVGGPRGGRGPGTGGKIQIQCSQSNKSASVALFAGSGNGYSKWSDPVATRGYPLGTNIYVNGQSKFPNVVTPVGLNGSFTYGLALRTAQDGTRYLIDEDGTEFAFGKQNTPLTPEPGVYAKATLSGSTVTIDGAGPPGKINIAGNFRYEFDANTGRLLRLRDPSANVQEVTYDAKGNPLRVTDLSTKKVVQFEYDSPGLIARVVENGGIAVTHLSYQGNRLSRIVLRDGNGNPINEAAYTYDSAGRLASVVADNDAASKVSLTYTDPGGGSPSRANMSWGSGSAAGATNLDYLSQIGPSATRVGQKNAQGGVAFFDFDQTGNLVQVVSPKPDGASSAPATVYTFDANRNVTSVSDGLTKRTFTYNSLGKVTKIADAAGGEWNFTYNGVDLTGVSDAVGSVLALSYDDPLNPHSPTSYADANGNIWTMAYNKYGQILSVTPPDGAPTGATNYTYDEDGASPSLGYLKQVLNGVGDITSIDAYSQLGQIASLTTSPRDGVSNTRTFEYDPGQRLTKTTFPDGAVTRTEYQGRFPSKQVDQAGNETGLGFCSTCGALEAVKLPLSKTLTMNHNGDHDVASFVDGRNKSTAYTYGAARELKQTRYPDGTTISYQYDSTGRLSLMRNGRNQTAALSYDQAGRVTKQQFSNGQPAVEYTYYADGRVRTMKDEAGTTSYSYTANRLLESVSYDYSASGLAAKQVINYVYNPDQTLRTMTWSNGTAAVAQWSYEYDAAGRVISVSDGFGDSTAYTYDHEGKIVSQKNSNGTESSLAYIESRGWPSLVEWRSGGESFASYGLTYDQGSNTVGNLTSVVEANGVEATYGYDALYRVISESRTGGVANTFQYDLAGNITGKNGSTFAAYDDGNKIQSIPGGTVAYDGDGNLTAASLLTDGAFSWDVRNKLRSAGGLTYLYDGSGRRVARTGEQTTFYIFSGSTLIGEVTSGSPRVAYTWGADGLVSQRVLDAGQSLFYHFGPQGETRQLTDASGAVADTYAFDAYGQELKSTGADANPFRYGGKVGYYTDGAKVLAGARWYSPKLMRWLSRDPIGYGGGDNQYGYVGGNPVGEVDPSGLEPLLLFGPDGKLIDSSDGGLESPLIDPVFFIAGGVRSVSSGIINTFRLLCGEGATYRLVVGKLGDIAADSIGAGEYTLLQRLPDLGSPSANWYQNAGVLRSVIRLGIPIRDASVDEAGNLINNTGFLRAERNLLMNKGWSFDPATRLWSPGGR